VAAFWWTDAAPGEVSGTRDPELYRYGVHGRDFWVNVTVGPGRYHARLKFAATRGLDTQKNCFDIRINGRRVVERLDVAGTAGGSNRAVDLVFNDLTPTHGVIELRFTAASTSDGEKTVRGEAFIQAMEIGPSRGGRGATPVSTPALSATANLLLNAGFEETGGGRQGVSGINVPLAEWHCQFLGPSPGYIWQEADYAAHPDWGLPEFHSGKGAIRTHTDTRGHMRIYQDVEVEPNKRYTTSVWLRTANLRGKGFGQHPDDSAALEIWEMDSTGKTVNKHGRVERKTAGPYAPLRCAFLTTAATAQVRFILDTVINCPYAEGHVTYDDCELRVE